MDTLELNIEELMMRANMSRMVVVARKKTKNK